MLLYRFPYRQKEAHAGIIDHGQRPMGRRTGRRSVQAVGHHLDERPGPSRDILQCQRALLLAGHRQPEPPDLFGGFEQRRAVARVSYSRIRHRFRRKSSAAGHQRRRRHSLGSGPFPGRPGAGHGRRADRRRKEQPGYQQSDLPRQRDTLHHPGASAGGVSGDGPVQDTPAGTAASGTDGRRAGHRRGHDHRNEVRQT